MNMRRRVTIMAAALLLVFGLLAAILISHQASMQVAGGWCGQSCPESVVTPVEVAGGWCGQSCTQAVEPRPTPKP